MSERAEHNTYFPALTGVRALAVYLVYLHHTNPFSEKRYGSFLHHLINEFHIGVSIFFVLSGFLITFRYYDGSFKKEWFKRYVQNRIARVYPMYFLLTSLAFIFLFFQNKQGDHPLLVYVMNISFLRGFFDELKFTLVAQGWTLTVEECFYFSAPLIFMLLKKHKWWIIIFPMGLILIGCWIVNGLKGTGYYGFFRSYHFLFVYTFFGRCFEFFCGIGLALYFKNKLAIERKGSLLTYGGLVLITLLVILLSLLAIGDQSGIHTSLGIIINNFFLPISISLFFYGLISESSIPRNILSSSFLVMLGKVSYTFYLIQIGFFYVLIRQHISENYALIFLCLNFIAIALWYLVENPLNKAIRRL